MIAIDLRILSIALGFTVVALCGDKLPKKEAAQRATNLAGLIEEFCLTKGKAPIPTDMTGVDKLIIRYKNELQATQKVELTTDHDLLLQLYDRMHQRHRSYATDNLLADAVEYLLQEEILYDSGFTKESPLNDEQILSKFDVQSRMAEAIANITQEKGGCLPQDLNAKGFSPEEVTRYWAMASALAAVKRHKGD